MNTNLIALNFGSNLANILLNLSFIAMIVLLLILFFRMLNRDNGNIEILFILLCFVTFFVPAVVAIVVLGSTHAGTDVGILNVLDNFTILGLFSASRLVIIDFMVWLWIIFFFFITMKFYK